MACIGLCKGLKWYSITCDVVLLVQIYFNCRIFILLSYMGTEKRFEIKISEYENIFVYYYWCYLRQFDFLKAFDYNV